jgi:transketolase
MVQQATATRHASDLDERAVNTIRFLAVDAVETAKAGHPGMPMGAAPMAYVLWTRFLRHNPSNPSWPARDRFVLSAGHGSMLLYALLYLTGYDLTLEDLRRFRRLGSRTPGHPEFRLTPGVEATTGPLGQGFANGVGMAMAQRLLQRRFDRPGFSLFPYRIFAIVSDGDLMEGISSEAASLAGHLRLGNLVYLYDDNGISIEGPTDLAFTEDVTGRLQACGWHVQTVADGNDLAAIEAAIAQAVAEEDRPSLIRVRTHIGYGSPHRQDTAQAHGAPLGPEETRLAKEHLGWPLSPEFYVPEDVLFHMRQAVERGQELQANWETQLKAYARAYPQEAQELSRVLRGELPQGWDTALPSWAPGQMVATRAASGETLQVLKDRVPELVGGSADLAPSTDTYLKGEEDFAPGRPGRNVHFGVREHAMGAILNGMAYHGGVRPYGATFLVFSDYMRPAIRLAALSHLPVVYVFTHDSLAVGEDGPTHQPVEHLASLRAIPGLVVLRPADAVETAHAWRVALAHKEGPVALVLTRQKVPVLERGQGVDVAQGVARGAYVLADAPSQEPRLLLLATGSEVQLALEAYRELTRQGVACRVVSMPSWELFERQDPSYRSFVLPPHVRARVAVEMASPMGWERYVGGEGEILGLGRFGASGSLEELLPAFGFTVEEVLQRAWQVLRRTDGR